MENAVAENPSELAKTIWEPFEKDKKGKEAI